MTITRDTTTPETETPSKRQPIRQIVAAALSAIFVILYFATKTHYNTFDAVSYANQIERLFPSTHNYLWLFHPHHLLFNVTGYVGMQIAHALGWRGNALTLLEEINAIAGAIGLAELYFILQPKTDTLRLLPIVAVCGIGVSYGYWIAATDGRVNMVSAVLLISAFRRLTAPIRFPRRTHTNDGAKQTHSYRRADRRVLKQVAGAAVMAALAALYHESATLFVPAGMVGAAICGNTPQSAALRTPHNRRRLKRRTIAVRQALLFLGVWLAIVVSAYAIVGIGVLGLHSPAAFRQWAAEYADLGWWWDFRIAHNLPLDIFALKHAVVAIPIDSDGAAAQTFYKWSAAGCVIAVVITIATSIALWKRRRRRYLISWIWIAAYSAFFTVWSPGYFIFWIPVVIALAILAVMGVRSVSQRRTVDGAVSLATLIWIVSAGIVNWATCIKPHLRADGSPFQRVAREVSRKTSPGDLIVITGEGDLAECEANIPYFGDRDTMALHTEFTRNHDDPIATKIAVQSRIVSTVVNGHSVYFFDEALKPKVASALLLPRHRTATEGVIRSYFAPWRTQRAWVGDHGPVWRLIPNQAHPRRV